MDNNQLLRAVEEHTRYVFNRKEPSKLLAKEVAKATAIRQRGGLTDTRIEAITSTLEHYLLQNPQGAALYRSTDGTYLPEFAEPTGTALVAGYAPSGFQTRVKDKL